MRDEDKTREQLIEELRGLRGRVSELETSEKDRRRAEMALQDQLHFLQTLIDTIPNPIFYKDRAGFYLGCNEAFEARLGLKKGEILGKTAHELFPEDLADRYDEMDLALFRHPGEQIYETSLLYADGRRHDVILNKGTFTNSDGAPAGLVGVTVDITERKQAEEELRKAHDELELRVDERTVELARANEELREEIAQRRRAEEALQESSDKLKFFAYSVAHDLKSPTIGIHGLTRLLSNQYRDALEDRGKAYCDQILKASESVAALVEKINSYAAAKEALMAFEEVSMEEIFQMARDEFTAKLAARGVSLIAPAASPRIRADRLSMIRVFRNLVDNALKYGGERLTEVRIDCGESEDYHLFSVTDDGVGVKPESAERVFELFQREKRSKGIEGSGLGLAIVKEIVEHHGGKIWIQPGQGRGVTFCLSISKRL